MKTKSLLLILLLLFAFTAANAATVDKTKKLSLMAKGIETLEVDCGSGYLKIKGVDGLKEIQVKATIVIKGIDEDEIDELIKDSVKLKLSQRGSRAVLVSKFESGIFKSLFGRKSGLINLDVRVPKKMALDIDDGSGFIEIYNIDGDLDMDDGSGSLEINGVSGDVDIDDGSGSIEIENIGGNLNLDDGSGGIEVTKVGGDVDIDDSSGSMSVYDVKGSVVVSDGSGSILIDGVGQDVHIKRSGSGGLTIRNVSGKVRR
jgi:hypothetical protein